MTFFKKHAPLLCALLVFTLALTVLFFMSFAPSVPPEAPQGETTSSESPETKVSEKPSTAIETSEEEAKATADEEMPPSASPAFSDTPEETEVPDDTAKSPEKAEEASPQSFCTLSVRCDTLLSHLDRLPYEERTLVPADGIIFPEQAVPIKEGDSVFDVLKRELRAHNIHLEFSNTPLYKSVYVEGIANLYEFDAGELSGWMYKVNGVFPGVGSSSVSVSSGDLIEWVYTCDLGYDVGGGGLDGNGG